MNGANVGEESALKAEPRVAPVSVAIVEKVVSPLAWELMCSKAWKRSTVDGQRQHAVEVHDCLITKKSKKEVGGWHSWAGWAARCGKVNGRGAWGCRFVAEASDASTKETRPRSGGRKSKLRRWWK